VAISLNPEQRLETSREHSANLLLSGLTDEQVCAVLAIKEDQLHAALSMTSDADPLLV